MAPGWSACRGSSWPRSRAWSKPWPSGPRRWRLCKANPPGRPASPPPSPGSSWARSSPAWPWLTSTRRWPPWPRRWRPPRPSSGFRLWGPGGAHPRREGRGPRWRRASGRGPTLGLHPEGLQQPPALRRQKVDARGIATRGFDHALVHHGKPQRRHVSDQEHARVAQRQEGGDVVEAAQRLVAARRVGVVVGMPLQLEGQDVGQHVVAVPRVVRLAVFVAAIGLLLAQQAVVLDVV